MRAAGESVTSRAVRRNGSAERPFSHTEAGTVGSWSMDDPQVEFDARTALLAERKRVLAELADTKIEAPGPMTYGSQAAAASHVVEQQRDLALRDHNEQHLAAVAAALDRLDAGTYGRCTSCHRQIAPERLEALPWAALCIDCQRAAAHR
jgi:DnaK suppressor protein